MARYQRARLHGLMVLKALNDFRHLAGRPGAEYKALACLSEARQRARLAGHFAVPLIWTWRHRFERLLVKLKGYMNRV